MLFEYCELSISANIHLYICNTGSFFALTKLQHQSVSSTLTRPPCTIYCFIDSFFWVVWL